MSILEEWWTVREAAAAVGRKPRTVYEWIQKGLLRTRTNRHGATIVLAEAVGRIAAERKRGRPRGIPTRR